MADLVPIRWGRMSASPFAFYRGSAALMAADLAPLPRTGLTVQLCGDAHLSNFGLYGSPERELLFDVNDFDETLPGPFEWDLKRLAASFVLASRNNGSRRRRGPRDRPGRRTLLPRAHDGLRRDARARRVVLAHRRRRPARDGARRRRRQAAPRASQGRGQIRREGLRQGARPRQPAGGRQAHRGRRRHAAHRRPAAAHHAPRGARRVEASYRLFDAVPGDPRRRPPRAPRALRGRRRGPQGGRRGQRRHALPHRPAARPRQRRSPVPAGQGGRAVGARALSRAAAGSATTATASSPASASCRRPATSSSAG